MFSMYSTDYAIYRASLIAKKASCKKAKVGCVISTKYGTILGEGYNIGECNNTCEAYRLNSIGDNAVSCGTVHAERMAIEQIPEDKKHLVFYAAVTKKPCDKCNEALKEIGVKYVIYSIG